MPLGIEIPISGVLVLWCHSVYVELFRRGERSDAFITPCVASQMIDFVYYLKHRTTPPNGVWHYKCASAWTSGFILDANGSVHSWSKAKVADKSVIPFNQRTETIEESIDPLEIVSIIWFLIGIWSYSIDFCRIATLRTFSKKNPPQVTPSSHHRLIKQKLSLFLLS